VNVFFITDDVHGAPLESGADDVAVIAVGGEIDYQATPSLREWLATRVAAGERRLLIDLSTATFIDSTAIGVLVGAAKRLQDAGDSLVVVCPQGNRRVRRIFDIAGVAENVITLYPSREEALLALTPTEA
jgi:anti-sigma B factor antagonist